MPVHSGVATSCEYSKEVMRPVKCNYPVSITRLHYMLCKWASGPNQYTYAAVSSKELEDDIGWARVHGYDEYVSWGFNISNCTTCGSSASTVSGT